jgi:hypothetical protein
MNHNRVNYELGEDPQSPHNPQPELIQDDNVEDHRTNSEPHMAENVYSINLINQNVID